MAGVNNDLHAYDPVSMTFFELSSNTVGTSPSARKKHGFTSTASQLYVHGGYNGNGLQLDRSGDIYARNVTDSVILCSHCCVFSFNTVEFREEK